MQISARSYLTAGISLTAASAIALTPLAIPANDRTVTIPNVTVSDIQLTVTPGEVQEFFADLQADLSEFNRALAEVIALPGQTLSEGLGAAMELNADFFETLSGLTTNTTLLAVLDALYNSSNFGLQALQVAVDEANINLFLTSVDLSDLLTSSITGSLSNVLSSFVAVLNNPLDVANYAGILSNGLVATGELLAANGLQAVGAIVNSGFGFAYTGMELPYNQAVNAIRTVADLMNIGANATGVELVQAVNAAIQSVTLAPARAFADIAFGVSSDVLFAFDDGFNTALDGVQGLVAITGESLQLAINAIGAGPLNPENYLYAGGALLGGGFDAFNLSVATAGDVAQVPFALGGELTYTFAKALTYLNNDFATAMSGVLAAVGLPEDIVNAPLAIAAEIHELIVAGADAVFDGLSIGAGLIQDTTSFIIDVSNDIEDAIFGVRPDVPSPNLPNSVDEPVFRIASEPAGEVVAVADVTEEEVTEEVVEDTVVEDEAAADDDAAAEDDADEKDAASERSTRGTKTAEKDVEKADRDDKKSESSDSSDRDSDSKRGSDSKRDKRSDRSAA